ncbi:MAG: ATP-binding protein [Myxococcota bacterium]
MAKSSNRPRRTQELFKACLWLAQLLSFRLAAQNEGKLDTSLGLSDLVQELSDACKLSRPTLEGPPPLPEGGWMPSFSKLFGLSSMESLLVAAALAPTVDARFAQAFARFLNSNRPERPSADLLARLLAFTLPERMHLAAMLRVGAPLERFGLLLLDWNENTVLPLNFQPLQVPERIRWLLLDEQLEMPQTLQRFLLLHKPRVPLAEQPLDENLKAHLSNILTQLRLSRKHAQPPPFLLLEGVWGVGQNEVAEGLAEALNMQVIELDLVPRLSTQEPPELARLLRRELILQNAVLLMRVHTDEGGAESQAAVDLMQLRVRQFLELELKELSCPVVLSGNMATPGGLRELERPCWRYELRLPDRKRQKQALLRALEDEQMQATDMGLENLLNRYNLNLAATSEVVKTAHVLARSARLGPSQMESGELEAAVELILRRHLGSLSQRLSARFTWEDLILSDEIVGQLRTLRNLIEHRHLVFETWGLGRKASGGQGIKALLSGPSGTGKTMAAEVIASDLRLPLYRVDLSAVVSKWVGETEKNLEKIFREAQSSQAILLFDEADALFGKRGKVENANDRHSNVEVSFLLQRFEVHDGVVILTTNFPTVIDTAFARRMHFMIEFESPDEPTRRILWQKQLVPSLPKSNDIDIPWLAQRFEISGANIKNVVMGAAFLAAAEDRVVNMAHIARSMQWEYQKLGRSVSVTDFGRFMKR